MSNVAEQSSYYEAGGGNDPADVIVQVGDDVPSEYRDAIQASVATLAKRSAEASKRAFERSKARSEFLTALNRPLRRIIEEDAEASELLATASQHQQDYRMQAPMEEPAWPTFEPVDLWLPTDADAPASQVFTPPYHFQWQWYAGDAPTFTSLDRPNGRIELSTHADEDRNRSDAHGGFGVAMTTNTVKSVMGRSLRRTQHWFQVIAGSQGGSATVEGGMEMTALEDGRLLSAVQDKRYRRRVSSGEDDWVDFDGFATGETIDVDFVMRPGRTYTFNVGGWIFCEAHGGFGTDSFASTALRANVLALTAFFTD
jgi:hypothetical protein